MAVSAVSDHFLDTSSDGHSTSSLGSLFQCLAVVPVEEFLMMPNLNLPCLEAASSCAVVHKNPDLLPGVQQANP